MFSACLKMVGFGFFDLRYGVLNISNAICAPHLTEASDAKRILVLK
jgi:hypothetical protein